MKLSHMHPAFGLLGAPFRHAESLVKVEAKIAKATSHQKELWIMLRLSNACHYTETLE
jgi:hypothetical protein